MRFHTSLLAIGALLDLAAAAAVSTGTSSSSRCPHPPKRYTSNYDRLRSVYTSWWDSWMYPNNVAQARSINSTFFSPTVQGRVDVTTTFDGPELNTEYVYGLFSSLIDNPDAVSLLAVPMSYELRSFLGAGNFVSGSVVGQFKSLVTNKTRPLLIKLDIMLDECDRIQQYDAIFDRFDWLNDVSKQDFVPLVAKKLGISASSVTETVLGSAIKAALAQSVCGVHEKFCTGANKQYKDNNECLSFLGAKDVGKTYAFGQDNIACRSLHSNMVPLRPEVHCPHIGKTGGGMCVDRDYTQVTEQKYFKTPMILAPRMVL